MKTLSAIEQKALDDISRLLKIDSIKLKALIDFESRWNPMSRNAITGAIGLIQFMPTTLRKMGFSSPGEFIDKNPDIVSQLKYVYKYLKGFAPFPTDKKLFMSVFYPKASTWPDIKLFPELVRKSNPGIVRVADYMRKVYIRIGLHYTPTAIFFLVGSIAIYLIYKKST